MQTCRQSRFEVGADFGVSLLVNLVTQVLFYGALATAGRSLTFAALVLGLAVPRRYGIRRLFNAAVAPGRRQARWHAWLEVLTDTAVALLLALVAPAPVVWRRSHGAQSRRRDARALRAHAGAALRAAPDVRLLAGPPGQAAALGPAVVVGTVLESPALWLFLSKRTLGCQDLRKP